MDNTKYKVNTPFILILGIVIFTVFLIPSGISIQNGNVKNALAFGAFAILGFFMIAHFSRIIVDENRVIIKKLLGQFSLEWSEITSIETGNGNLVFYAGKKRMTSPSFEHWSGKEKDAALNLVDIIANERNIHIKETFRGNLPGCFNSKHKLKEG